MRWLLLAAVAGCAGASPRQGEPLAPLQEKFSEVSPGTSVIDASSDAPYREAALCLQPGECAVVHGPSAWHVLKRVN